MGVLLLLGSSESSGENGVDEGVFVECLGLVALPGEQQFQAAGLSRGEVCGNGHHVAVRLNKGGRNPAHCKHTRMARPTTARQIR